LLSRLKNFQAKFLSIQVDAYLITNDVDVSYLTQFTAAESWLLVLPKKSYYLTDSRYFTEARTGLKGVTVCQYPKSLAETLFVLLAKHRVHSLGFDSRHLSLAQFQKLRHKCPKGIKLKACDGLVDELRQVKEPEEVAAIRDCIKVNLAAYQYLARYIRPGVTERDLLQQLERFILKKGVKFSFAPIIASGPNAALPHARGTERRLAPNDVLLIDMGIDINGYKSDLTRIFFLGKIAPLLEKRYRILREAQEAAIAAIRPGVKAAEVDLAARNYLKKQGLDTYFGHALGHGVGLEVHEAPRISRTSAVVLKEGMVFTVEPGIYFPGKYGFRIEDMVVVTRGGCEILSRT